MKSTPSPGCRRPPTSRRCGKPQGCRSRRSSTDCCRLRSPGAPACADSTTDPHRPAEPLGLWHHQGFSGSLTPLAYFLPAATFFFSPLTMALKSAPARNLGTDDLATLMDAPVAGFRAVRAGRSDFSKTPNPVIATLSPLATACWIVSRIAFTASLAVFLSPNRPETASIRSRLFMSSLLRSPNGRARSSGPLLPASATSDVPEGRRCDGGAQ